MRNTDIGCYIGRVYGRLSRIVEKQAAATGWFVNLSR
jgi:hypothetical protein